MVQFWSSLASRDTRLMTHVLSHHFPGSFRERMSLPQTKNAPYAV